MTKSLVIVGASSFAEIAKEYFDAAAHYKVAAFAVDRVFLKQATLLGLPVVALEEIAEKYPAHDHDAFVALTYGELNRNRAQLVARMRELGYRLASYISDRAIVWPNVTVGENCFIFENNVVQPFVSIGDNVILWSGNHIGHHSRIDDNVFIASHVVVSGHVTIGRNCFLGVNATVADSVAVAEDNWIGPNALITQDTRANEMYRAEPTVASKVSSHRFFRIRPSNA